MVTTILDVWKHFCTIADGQGSHNMYIMPRQREGSVKGEPWGEPDEAESGPESGHVPDEADFSYPTCPLRFGLLG
jgi:hypothetical protein